MRLYRRGAARQNDLSDLTIAERKDFDGCQAEASGSDGGENPRGSAVARWVIAQKLNVSYGKQRASSFDRRQTPERRFGLEGDRG